ncbi:MAG TPA: hypothetical protein VFB54_14815 [Burkholderiales bacterium]|nr:hypothetical protein [Burkholderiales bacterium]
MAMAKVLIFVKRAENIERTALYAWLLEEHAAQVKQMPGLRRFTVSTEAEGLEQDFDALLELWFDAAPGVERALESVAGKALLADLEKRASRVERVVVAEHKFVDAQPSAAFKLVAALKRREDLTPGQFKSWWLDRHAPIVVTFPELGRYQVDIVEEGAERFVDGVAEVSFKDLPTLKRIMSTKQVKDTQGDSQVHTRARYRMFVEEHRVIA